MNLLYEFTSEAFDCLQKRFDGILFSSSLHVILKGSVLRPCVHRKSYGLTMAAACPLSPRDRKVSHSSFYCSEGCSRAPPLWAICALDPHFSWARTGASSRQTSIQQSKRHYVTKVRTQRKERKGLGCNLGPGLYHNTALCTEFVIQLFHIKRHLVSMSGFTETYIYIQPVCSFCLAKNRPNLHDLL